jgi:hypothetical protein
MYPYTKELTLDEALNTLLNAKCQSYEKDGKVFLTPLDYATHILKQAAPPEGYGYAAYELGSGRYDELPYCFNFDKHLWRNSEAGFSSTRTVAKDWYEVAFPLTDLARVEGTDTDKTEPPIPPSGIRPPVTCCPKCYWVITELKQEISELEAKNKELQSDLHNTVKHNKSLGDNHIMEVYDLRVENDKLKNYIINQLLNN